MKVLSSLSGLLLIFLCNTSLIYASNFQTGQEININTTVEGNLYLAAAKVQVNAPIYGDLICAGGEIVVQDTVSKDLTICGGQLQLLGYVGDDLRVAGGSITISGTIEGDLIIAGGEVIVMQEAIINGDVLMAGGSLRMNGVIKGTADLRGGEVVWNGVGERGIIVKAGKLNFTGISIGTSQLAASDIVLGQGAKFYSNVEYWNTTGNLDFGSSLMNGVRATYNEELKVYESDFNWRYLGLGMVVFWIYRFLVAAVLIGLLIWMFHYFFTRHSKETSQNLVSHLAYGFLYLIGIPIAAIIAFITIIGIPVGMVILTFYGLTVALGAVIAAVLIAYGWDRYYDKNWNRLNLFWFALLSYVMLKVVGIIPFLGSLVSLLVVTGALGTLFYIWWKNRNRGPVDLVE